MRVQIFDDVHSCMFVVFVSYVPRIADCAKTVF